MRNDFAILSGGQTGADRGGMDAAIQLGLKFTGWAPKGFRAEDGVIPALYREHMKQTLSTNYGVRTKFNIRDSDAMIIITFESHLTGGSAMTERIAGDKGRHVVLARNLPIIPEIRDELLVWLRDKRILNVAGSRESKAPGIQVATRDMLVDLLRQWCG